METIFKHEFWDKNALSTALANDDLSPQTVRKAQKWGRINDTSKIEIFARLIETNNIRFGEYTVRDLFDEIK